MSTDIKKFHTRKEFDPKVWEDLVSRFHYLPGGFSDMSVFETLKTQGQGARRAARLRRQRPLLLRHGAALLRPALRQPAQRRLQGRPRLEAHHRREAVRHRPAVGARAQPGGPRQLAGEPDLPGRSLPREGDGAEPARLPVLQRDVRAALEQELHRQHPVQRVRGRRCRGARRLLRLVRRAARHDAKPHVPDARVSVHGGPGLVRARRDPQREGEAPAVGARATRRRRSRATWCAGSTARCSTTRARSSSPATAARRT